MKNRKIKQVSIPLLVCIVSIIIGLTTNNSFLGVIILITGILNYR